jgi:hypothetical protein
LNTLAKALGVPVTELLACMEAQMEREQLKRELSEAVAVYQHNDLIRVGGLVAEIEALGPAYRYNARRLRSAVQRKDQAEAAMAGELIQVLAKLEAGM